MCAHWNSKDVPHKGWILIDVIDIREDGQPIDETEYEKCMMCGNERIRYVHIVEHKDFEEEYRVGCICAEKMTEDYVNPREREKELKQRSNERISWIKKKWNTSKSGNHYLNIDGNNLVVFDDSITGKYKCKINDKFGSKTYNEISAAKIGLFNKIEELKQKGKWF
jgi:hypothetical protein